MGMKNFKLIISYDGTNYHGWQVQDNALSIQGKIEESLLTVFNTPIRLRYSSRTDAGVHAYYQVASFKIETSMNEENLKLALNSMLPQDIAIVSVSIAPDEFDARRSVRKIYKYVIENTSTRSPFSFNRAWWLPYKLDFAVMFKASRFLIGTHDFKAFMSHGSDVKTTVRNIYDVNITVCTDNIIFIHINADGFLKQMVRNIVGTLVDVARGYIEPEKIKDILGSEDRRTAGVTAPACGLYLEQVFYE
jgi:tRNA pseudouridine38-40 synthase